MQSEVKTKKAIEGMREYEESHLGTGPRPAAGGRRERERVLPAARRREVQEHGEDRRGEAQALGGTRHAAPQAAGEGGGRRVGRAGSAPPPQSTPPGTPWYSVQTLVAAA